MRQVDQSTLKTLSLLTAVTALVAVVAVIRDYSFFPNRVSDGFFEQVHYVRGLISQNQWRVFLSDPLTIVHLVRFAMVSPFLAAEALLGPAAAAIMLCLLLWPLLIAFPTSDGSLRSVLFLSFRLAILMLPLVVSGRTVLVAAGMGYLVIGILVRPYSSWKMIIGVLFGALSSGALLLSLAVVIFAGNARDRSSAYYRWKICMVVFVMLIIAPSIIAKFYGFSYGASGYGIDGTVVRVNTLEGDGEAVIDDFGADAQGPLAALQRLLVRSTVVQSYLGGNYARLALYALLWGAAAWYVIASFVERRWNPMLVVILILSTGVLVEGLSVWPLLFPVIWVYTGYVAEKRESSPAELRVKV